ncbi:glycosyltransferase [Isoptericola croceus]|uniref:glycosyltransferase n=1 Tax=Isoptericola croceus TaxID=3031406 RepID=UPI0023F93BDE|nr:glycosyltransferase family 2 protein [Isoptericola croceus]
MKTRQLLVIPDNSTDATVEVTVLIPAHNEEKSIAMTLEAVLSQDRPADRVVVVANGCDDRTADIARSFPVTVMEFPRLAHRKAEALNIAWAEYAKYSDVVVCLDADTVLPPNALRDWEIELTSDVTLGGSSSKFTMQQPGILSRLQKAEFATWTDTALRKGWTSVLAGTGCAISGAALRVIAARDDRQGPWSYESATEDFELTYRIRESGWKCHVSTTVRAYTDSMSTIRALWGQRMKWQTGTVEDLLTFGLNRLTWRDWGQQALGLLNGVMRLLWIFVLVGAISMGMTIAWFWWCFPLLFVWLEVYRSMRIPHRDRKDMLLAASFFPAELFTLLRLAWFWASWASVVHGKMTHKKIDRWAAQYAAEGA